MTPDLLIENAHILTMNAGYEEISDGAIAVSQGRIAAIGPRQDLTNLDAQTRIDAKGGIVMPGLINAHCHAAMAMFRGIADDLPLDEFLGVVWPAEGRLANARNVQTGATLGMAEMVSGGVTHVVDMYWHAQATATAARDVGIGLTTGPLFVGTEGVDATPWAERIAHVDDVLTALRALDVDIMVMPHSCYALDREQLCQMADLAGHHGLGIHIHAAEAPSEMKLMQDIHQARPPQVMADTGILRQPTLIAHAVHLRPGEMAQLAEAGAAVAHCPLSNAKLASGTAKIAELRAAGVTVALGTDGPSSSNDLDMWQAMRHASLSSANLTSDPASLPAHEVLGMATRDGARAIGLGDRKGSLEVGKDADIAVIDMSALHLIPSFNPYSTLVFSAGRSDVSHVIAGGKLVYADRKLAFDMTRTLEGIGQITDEILSDQNR